MPLKEGSEHRERIAVAPKHVCAVAFLAAIALHCTSPSWHRRRRQRRANTRRTLRRGLQPSRGRLLQLAAHHGTNPRFSQRLVVLMGRNGWRHQGQQQPWSYWQGAWSPRKAPWKAQPDGQDAAAGRGKNPFPTYDGKKPSPSEPSRPLVETVDCKEAGTDSLVGDLQTVLNAARKQESRVKRLTQDK